MIVVDASAMVRFLGRVGDDVDWVRSALRVEPEVHAPELIDTEVLQGLRGLVLRGVLSSEAAGRSVSELLEARVVRYPHRPFVERAWELRGQMTAYDAMYVALAEALDATLVTTDHRLARVVTTVDVAVPG